MFKKFLHVLLSALLLLVSACAGNDAGITDIEIDNSVGLFSDDTANDSSGVEGDSTDVAVSRESGLTIQWGTPLLNTEVADASPILQYFWDKFQVNMSLTRVPYALDSGEPIPDIFYANAAHVFDRGFTRTIPRAMIEIYAPDYAALLSSLPYGWELGRVGDTDEYIGLFAYDITRTYLKDFSAYRLDWMEQLSIQPPGEMIEVAENVYFTPSAYTFAEFMHVMREFSFNELSELDAYTHGIGLYVTTNNLDEINTVHDAVGSMLGMWGINLNNMDIDGKAVPYFATEAYKDYLTFVRESGHYGEDIIRYLGGESFPRGFPVSWARHYEAGWSSLHLDSLPQALHAQQNFPDDKRFLITLPEIGPDGKQGGAAKHSGALFDMDEQWVINYTVSDALLINILQVFNALAFDPETFVMAAFGRAGTDFEWAGEPYDSYVIPANNWRTRSRNGVGMFGAGTMDGNAGKMVYWWGDSPVYHFAKSEAGRNLVIWPYKDDITGKAAAVHGNIERGVKAHLLNLSKEFYYAFVFEEDLTVDGFWDYYMDQLYENGLQEYLDYLDSCDVVNN